MRVTALLVSLVMGLALCAGAAQADVIYDTLSGGYNPTSGSTVSGISSLATDNSYAQPFTVSAQDFTLSSVQIAAVWAAPDFGTGPSVRLSLLADNGGLPGSEIESLGTKDATVWASVIEFNSAVHPLLEAGKTYWIGAFAGTANSWVAWCDASPETTGLAAIDTGDGWEAYSEYGLCAMRINTDPVVPEPSSLLALITGAAGLASFALRRSSGR